VQIRGRDHLRLEQQIEIDRARPIIAVDAHNGVSRGPCAFVRA
jgi:hypothetical protein